MWFCRSGFGPGPLVTPGGARSERIGRTEAEHREERRDHEHHDERPAHEDIVGAVTEPPRHGGGEHAQGERPEQDRPFERRPHGGDVVQRRRVGRADLLDVRHREVAGDQRPLHHDHREHDAPERHEGVHRAPLEQPLVLRANAVEHGERPEHARREHEQESGSAECRVDAGGDEHHGAAGSGQPAASASATRSSFTATYSSECFTSTRSPWSSPFSITPCTTTGMHSLKMPPGSPS